MTLSRMAAGAGAALSATLLALVTTLPVQAAIPGWRVFLYPSFRPAE
jgi:hypothetical protein